MVRLVQGWWDLLTVIRTMWKPRTGRGSRHRDRKNNDLEVAVSLGVCGEERRPLCCSQRARGVGESGRGLAPTFSNQRP